MSNDVKVINVKLDADTKNKFEILCFMKNKKLPAISIEARSLLKNSKSIVWN